MGQVLNRPEGSFRVVQASASANSLGQAVWATASAPASALYAYVMEGWQVTSAVTYVQPDDRGYPQHHLWAGNQVVKLQFSTYFTGAYPSALTASGASVAAFHGEWKATQPEVGTGLGTGRYLQFYMGVTDSITVSEANAGNKLTINMTFLNAGQFTGSGFLS